MRFYYDSIDFHRIAKVKGSRISYGILDFKLGRNNYLNIPVFLYYNGLVWHTTLLLNY